MEFTAWNLFTDLGFIFLLLTIGKLCRAWLKSVQVLFLPASVIAGLLGLLLGPNGFGLIPFSDQLGTYTSILIAIIFAALPLGQVIDVRAIAGRVGALWSYSQAMYFGMWGLGLMFSLLVLGAIWDLPRGFGLILAAGFAGGHGTAAAIGTAFGGLGWEEAASLGFTAATVGVVVAILGGLLLVKWGAHTGRTAILSDFKDLPTELRTGLVPRANRKSIGEGTTSSASLDPLAFHLGLVVVVAAAGYYATELVGLVFPRVSIAVFALAFIIGLVLNTVLSRTSAIEYIDRGSINSIVGVSTDLLVAFGIAAIVPSVVASYIVPLTLLFLFGILYCVVIFVFVTPRIFSEYAFERGIFTWGWSTGAVAMGLALLKIVDPELESKTLEDYGLAYIPIVPVEVLVVSFAPLLVVSGYSWPFIAAVVLMSVGGLIFARAMGWWGSGSKKPKSTV